MAAPVTWLPAAVVDLQEVPDLALERGGHALAEDRDRVRQGRARGRLQLVHFFWGECPALAEGLQPRGVEDFI